jgi:hypothetical protein
MLNRIHICLVLFSCWFCPSRLASAADLKILPGDITLTGPHAAQRLLVAAEEAGAVVGDRTGQAAFTSADPAVAVVDGGVVRPVGNLPTLIELKLAARRYRDFGDVVELIRFNNLDEAFAARLHPTVHGAYRECLE